MQSPRHILLVEDDDSEREALRRVLRIEGYVVTAVGNPQAALEQMSLPIDLVITDLCMGHQSGLDLLREWRERRPQTPFLMMTAFGTVSAAVDAMKLGALDFLAKPVDPALMLQLLAGAIGGPLGFDEDSVGGVTQIIGQSLVIERIREQIIKAADSDSTVLILGESGTGKELAAEAIHHHSPRSEAPLVVVNMAAVPESLVESELFGHVKGAFTNAISHHVGRFEAARGGTLFIDEIGDVSKSVQSKLLRALETHVFMPVGGDDTLSVDVRVVAATSRPLLKLIAEGEFREDLYYRLNVVVLRLPSLRERREDIPLLTRYFLDNVAHRMGKVSPAVSPELMSLLQQFDWPGNVRQLKNCLESLCVLSHSARLTPADLPADLHQLASPSTVETGQLDSVKKRAMLDALHRFSGNRTHAAQHLGISVRTLQRKLREWNLSDAP